MHQSNFRFRVHHLVAASVVVGLLLGMWQHRDRFQSRREQNLAEMTKWLGEQRVVPYKYQFTDVARNVAGSGKAIVVFEGPGPLQDRPAFQEGIARFLVDFQDRYPEAPVLIHYQKTMEVPTSIHWYEKGEWLDHHMLNGDPAEEVDSLIRRTAELYGLQMFPLP